MPSSDQPAIVPADMVRVVVRAQHAGQLHAVGLDDVEQVLHRVGRVDHDGLARRAVADEVDEVDHLAGHQVALGEVAARESCLKYSRGPSGTHLTHRRHLPFRLATRIRAGQRLEPGHQLLHLRPGLAQPPVQLVDQGRGPLEPRHQHVDVDLTLFEELDDGIELPTGLGVAQLLHRHGCGCLAGASVAAASALTSTLPRSSRPLTSTPARRRPARSPLDSPCAHGSVGQPCHDLLPGGHVPCAPHERPGREAQAVAPFELAVDVVGREQPAPGSQLLGRAVSCGPRPGPTAPAAPAAPLGSLQRPRGPTPPSSPPAAQRSRCTRNCWRAAAVRRPRARASPPTRPTRRTAPGPPRRPPAPPRGPPTTAPCGRRSRARIRSA